MKQGKSQAAILFIVTVTLVTILMHGSGSIDATEVDESGESTIYLPVVRKDITPIIPETTEVLSAATTDKLNSISQDGVTYTFDQMTLELAELDAGDVMVGHVSSAAPYGFLRKVTNVAQSGGDVVVTTEAATLEDAIQQGHISLSRKLVPADVQDEVLLRGVSYSAAENLDSALFMELIEVVLYDDDGNLETKNDQIRANGSITIELEFEFDATIKPWALEELSFIQNTTETAALTISSNVEYPLIEYERIVASYPFATIMVPVGICPFCLPVFFTPTLDIKVGVDGSANLGVTTGVTQQAKLSAGLAYSDGSWSPISDFSNSFDYIPPTLSAGLDMKGYVGAELSLKVYGVVGPYADLQAYLKLEADVTKIPWWQLYGGLELQGGVKIEILSHYIAGYEATLIDFPPVLLDQANIPPKIPGSSSPADGAIGQSLTVDLSWSGGDPDGDSVTYDVYFEANDATPDVLVSNDQSVTTYDPGTLSANTQHYWQIVATDEHGETTQGPIWDFTTGSAPNTPPNTPSSPLPSDGAIDQSINANLIWTGGDPDGDAVTNDVYFEAGDGAPDVLLCDDTAAASCDPGTLNYDIHYYWQVIARDADGETTAGPVWDFTTGSNPKSPPNMPSSPAPRDGAIDQSINANLTWTGGDLDGDVVTYDVYFEAGDSAPDVLLCDDTGATGCDPGTLNYNTHYYWKVIARDVDGKTTTGPIWDFTTISKPNSPPNMPSSPAPIDGALDQNIDANLTWTGGDPDGDDVTYDVYFEASDNTPDVLICNDTATYSCDPGTLSYSTDYYWQVIANDGQDITTGVIWVFTTIAATNNPPYSPTNPSPADNANSVSISADLSWTGGDPDGNNITYDVYFEANNSSPSQLLCNDVASTGCDPGTLNYSTHYYWQVVASDGVATTPGPVWDFVTRTCIPDLLSPDEGAILDNGRSDFLDPVIWDFDWSDCSGASQYHLYVKHPSATNPVIDDQSITTSTYHFESYSVIGDLFRFGWEWKVRANTGGQWGPWSVIRTFDVEPANTDPAPNNPPNLPSNPTPADNATNVSITMT